MPRFKPHHYDLLRRIIAARQIPLSDVDGRMIRPLTRASLHAKCVVVDERLAFISSANFTPAAHVKNIEAGVLVRSEGFAMQLSGHFRRFEQGKTL